MNRELDELRCMARAAGMTVHQSHDIETGEPMEGHYELRKGGITRMAGSYDEIADAIGEVPDDEPTADGDEVWERINAVAGNMDRRDRRMFREKTLRLAEWRDENEPNSGIDMLLVGDVADVVGDLSLSELYNLVALHYVDTDSRSAE